MFKIQNTEGGARTGVLRTSHGNIKTPFFMPVATKLTTKQITPMELHDMGVRSIISNAYVSSLRPGLEVIKKAGGAHKFMQWNNCLFSDSGGFQMLSESFFKDIDDTRVRFADPFSGRIQSVSPEDVIQIERELGSDVAMCLDHVPHVRSERCDIEDATRRTHLWAERCKTYHDAHDKKNFYGNRQLLFGITQGGLHKDLREKSAKCIDGLDFDGVAIGGLCIGETREEMKHAIKWQMPHISDEKPRYLMGVGSPEDILNSVEMGIDCFDSIYPTQNARHNNVFTRNGNIRIDKGRFKQDLGLLDPACDCYVCKTFTRAYLHHLSRSFEKTYQRYLSYHNVYFLIKMMEEIRDAIGKGEFGEYRKTFIELYKNTKKI
ncbi:tRNA guanosine(34) transglycosylase Tgt [Candidatus Woesearchaeota archaeon]|nr:tRNA guanosine(34) transglycosylase Tgt [Candidatus Woesearchaeota archaeon]